MQQKYSRNVILKISIVHMYFIYFHKDIEKHLLRANTKTEIIKEPLNKGMINGGTKYVKKIEC